MYCMLTTEAEAEALISGPGPAWLFKHSNACGTSAAALDEFTGFLAVHPELAAGVVVVQQHRPLSAWISSRLKHVHQSPQVFLLQDGVVRWQASHWSITAANLAQALARLPSRAS